MQFMISRIKRYIRWLHTQWPAGHVEKGPLVNEDGSTNVPGLYIVGDLTGIPLLKFSSHSGARAVRTIVEDPAFKQRTRNDPDVYDLVVVGAGVSGVAAIAEARSAGLKAEIIEASEPFSTIVNFPRGKPIYTYPTDMTPAGELQFGSKSDVKEGLVEELQDFLKQRDITPRIAHVDRIVRRRGLLEIELEGAETLRSHRVIVAIGRSGNYRTLGISGEDRDIVYNRLHDPKDYCGKDIVVVGGGDNALETAIALTSCGSKVTLSYRKAQFSRPKPENVDKINALAAQADADVGVEQPTDELVATAAGPFIPDRPTDDECEGCGGKLRGYPADGECPGCGKPFHRRVGALRLMMSSHAKEINDGEVIITNAQGPDETITAQAVFIMIGREAPLDFFRRSGVRIHGEWKPLSYLSLAFFFAFCVFLYHWKSDAGFGLKGWFKDNELFPFNLVDPTNPSNLLGTILLSMREPSFWYSLAYCLCIVIFGIKRIKRRRTPYVKVQTLTLMAIQCVPLFLLPYIMLPWMGHNGLFDGGFGKAVADALFPLTQWDNHGREYWRSVGFILAWPLMFWNVFTYQPIWAWLIISLVQTFVIIPLIVWRWGKGAYCGWICSCGALAETMGDAHRHKMPRGPLFNRLNLLGQVFLWIITALLVLRIISWIAPGGWASATYSLLFDGRRADGSQIGGLMRYLNYVWSVDLLWAGIFGVAFYFWFSGRVWCRFACPLAALMHIYARFSQFRIISEKSKCISCNVCTSVCHQGIDVMNFANKGIPMEDPQCVRCSACVQSCPTGVLEFGRINRRTGQVIARDRLAASPVLMAEITVQGRRI